MVFNKSVSNKAWNKPMSNEKGNATCQTKDKIWNIVLKRRIRETDIAEYVTKVKWKRAEHPEWKAINGPLEAQNRRYRAWDQLKDLNVVGETTKNCKNTRHRKLAEGFFLQRGTKARTEQNRTRIANAQAIQICQMGLLYTTVISLTYSTIRNIWVASWNFTTEWLHKF